MKSTHHDIPTVRIREVAEIVGLSPSTIRKYEKLGLVLSYLERPNGHRLFSQTDIRWLNQLVAYLRREHVTPLAAARFLAGLPTRQKRLAAGLDDCKTDSAAGQPCWTLNAESAAWRKLCRRCPAMALRTQILSNSRSEDFELIAQIQALLMALDDTEAQSLAAATFKILEPLGVEAVELQVKGGSFDLHESYPPNVFFASFAPRSLADVRDLRLPLIVNETIQGSLRLRLSEDSRFEDNPILPRLLPTIVSQSLMRVAERQAADSTVRELTRRLTTTVYEAKTALSVVSLHIELLKRQLGSQDSAPNFQNRIVLAEGSLDKTADKLELLADASRSMSKSLPLNRNPTNLNEIIGDVCASVTYSGSLGDRRLVLRGKINLPGFWDRTRLKGVLNGITSCAVKYASSKEITIVLQERHEKARVVFPAFCDALHQSRTGSLSQTRLQELQTVMVSLELARLVVEAHDGALVFDVGHSLVLELPLMTEPKPLEQTATSIERT